MVLKRRAPGQRRRRSRREDELRQVSEKFPERVAELEELRRYNPQGFRRLLVKLTRKGKISRGRGVLVPPDVLALLDGDLAAVQAGVDAGLAAGDLTFRMVLGLLDEERGDSARPDVLAWLDARYQALLDEENRHVP